LPELIIEWVAATCCRKL